MILPLSKYPKGQKLHKYWSRKPWNIVYELVSRNSNPGETILDPFCGSGSIGLETITSGRAFIGYDLNPFACFLTEGTLNLEFDEIEFSKDFQEIRARVSKKIMDLYKVEDSYLLYAVRGSANKKDYNAVISSLEFTNKKRIILDDESMECEMEIPLNLHIPDREFPAKFYKDRFSYKGISKVSHMFSKRNLYALAILNEEIENLGRNRNFFKLAFSNTLLHVSKLKSENIRPLGVNNYWIPDDFIEENVWWRFTDRVKNVADAKSEHLMRLVDRKIENIGKFQVFNTSSLAMPLLKGSSIDYILTDPPYGDVIQYSELSFIWNTWLEKSFIIDEEVIINPVQNKDSESFYLQLNMFLKESYRVLKFNRKITVAFQNKDFKIWIRFAELARAVGFVFEGIEQFNYLGSPYNKNWSGKSPKVDLYLTLRKARKRIETTEKILFSDFVNLEQVRSEIDMCPSSDVKNKLIQISVDYIFGGGDIIISSSKEVDNFINSIEHNLI